MNSPSRCPIQDIQDALFRISIFGTAQRWVAKRIPLPKIYQTHPRMMKLGTVVSYFNLLLTSPFFYRKSATFVISRNTDIDCILVYNF